MTDYYSIPTTLGAAKIAAAANINQTLTITHMAFGDANGLPYLPVTHANATALVNERHRVAIEYLNIDSAANIYVTKARIPAAVGGFEINEIGLFDADGDLIYLANYPRTLKPQITQGAGGELSVKIRMMVSHSSVLTLVLDPHVITLTQANGDDRYALKTELDAEAIARTNADFALSIALAAEITNRENADAALNGFISTEATARANDDNAEATARANADLALSIALAAEITTRETAFNKTMGYPSRLKAQIAYLAGMNYNEFVTVNPNETLHIMMVGAGAGSGQVNENYSGVNDYTGTTNNGIADEGQPSKVTLLLGIGDHVILATAYGGKGGKSGMRDIGGDAGRYTGFSGDGGDAELNPDYCVLLNACKGGKSTNRLSADYSYPFKALASRFGSYGRGADGSNGTFGSGSDDAGHGGAGGNGGFIDFLYKNKTNSPQTLLIESGIGSYGYNNDIPYGNNYAGERGQHGAVFVYTSD